MARWAAAQESTPSPEAAQAEPAANPVQPGPASDLISFNFKGATFGQVIDFFSRSTGLPVIWKTPAPEGTLDYISPKAYPVEEALQVLNVILQAKGVMLRVDDQKLHLQKLEQMQKEDIPTFVGKLPEEVTSDQIVTLVYPLKIAMAKPLAEKLSSMVASYGAVTAMEQQNSLIITETAANIRRIQTMIDQLDKDDVEGVVEIFKIAHGRAEDLMKPLNALLGTKVEKYIVNEKGQQIKIEENQMPGLTMSADERTNSIIAKGVQNQIARLREAIALLDSPSTANGRSMTTMALSRISPADAAAKLNQLYARIPEAQRPTVIAMDDAAKVMILGDDAAISEGSLLIAEIENGPIGSHGRELAHAVIALEHAQAPAVAAAINNLLNQRQQLTTKVVAGPDGRSIIVSGPSGDVDSVGALVAVLDSKSVGARQIRIVRIERGDPQEIVRQAKGVLSVAMPGVRISDLKSQISTLESQRSGAAAEPTGMDAETLAIDLDVEARTVTLVGAARTIDACTSALTQIEASVVIEREARRFELTNVLPSEIIGPLTALAQQVLQPAAGAAYVAPTLTAIDQLNSLVVTAQPAQLSVLEPLVASIDVSKNAGALPPPRLLQLRIADAANLANVIMAQYNQRTAAERKAKPVHVGADPQTNSLIVAAHPDVLPEIQAMVDELNTTERMDLEAREIRIFPLKVARAEELARTVDEMFPMPPVPMDVRGRPQPHLQKPRPVVVRADPQTNSLIISALPGMVNLTQEMIAQLDIDPAQASGAAARSVHVLTVDNADASQLAANIEAMFSGVDQGPAQSRPTIRVDAASNSLLIRASDAQFKSIEVVVSKIDKATIASSRQMRMIAIDPSKSSAEEIAQALQQMLDRSGNGKVQVISLEELMKRKQAGESKEPSSDASSKAIDDRRSTINRGQQPAVVIHQSAIVSCVLAVVLGAFQDDAEPEVTIAVDKATNSLIILGSARAIERVSALARQIQEQIPAAPGTIRYVTFPPETDVQQLVGLLHQTLDQIAPRAGQRGDLRRRVALIADPVGNALIVAANDSDFETVADLITVLSKPASKDFPIRTVTLQRADAASVAKAIQQFYEDRAKISAARGGQAVQRRVSIMGIESSNALLIAASDDDFKEIENLVSQFDTTEAAAGLTFRVFELQHAKATEIERTVQNLVNDLIWNQGDRVFFWPPWNQPQQQQQQKKDTIAVRADARLNTLIVTGKGDKFAVVEKMIQMLDAPPPEGEQRVVRMYRLENAPLQTAAEIVREVFNQGRQRRPWEAPDPNEIRVRTDDANHLLIVSATAKEQDEIRSMIQAIDAQIAAAGGGDHRTEVVPVKFARATDLAAALTRFMAERARAANTLKPQATIVASDSANALMISAPPESLEQIRAIIAQADVADSAKLPAPQIVPISGGDPVKLAQSLMQLYSQSRPRGAAQGSTYPPLSIVGDAASNSIIVRAEEQDFQQIKALAETLQQQSSSGGFAVHVLKLKSAPASRIADALSEAYQAKARQTNQQLSIHVDPTGNSLVIASTGPMFEEIKSSVAELDAIAPAAGQGIFIIDLQNIPPETAKSVIETIGLDKQQPANSISRLVTEPIKVSLLAGRNAIVVVANPADRETVVGLMKAIDAEPPLAEAHTAVFKLKHAQAQALSQILAQVLKPGEQQTDTPLARAVREQVRRLAVRREGGASAALQLDLTKPVRVVPDPTLNALVISSTPENLSAIGELIAIFDQLPINEAVTVQLFPLQNIAAEQFARIVKEIFAQGKQLGKTAITKVAGLPDGVVGKALLEELAISTDDRTNTVVVAGTEQAVALVEVLSKRIDSDVTAGWVEPKVVPLRFADAAEMAETLHSILVEGVGNLPQSSPIQRQIGRLRMAKLNPNGGKVIESDVFTPMTRLVIRGEPQMNALILVGTPANIEIVSELVAMLDIESASPSNAVRIYPIQNASAARLAQTVRQLFDQQVQSKAIRPEDRVIVSADERTNALVVATSPRSFVVLEGLLKTLDSQLAPELREIRTIELKNSSATRLAAIIQQMMDARVERLRKVQPETADLERATVIADPRTNALVVAAGNDAFEVVRRLAGDLDGSTLGEAAVVHVFPMDKANVDRVAQTVNQIMERRYADMPPDLRRSQRPLVLTDSRTNSLLVTANPEDLASIQDLLTKLTDAPLNPAVSINLITLPLSTRAELIAPRVQRLMTERQASLGAAGSPSDRVSIEPDMASNSLIVAASEENLEAIRRLVDVLVQAEVAAGTGRDLEVVSLSPGRRASDIIDMLDDLYVREANRVRGMNTVRATADERLNAIVINAPPQDVRALKSLIAQLEGAKPAGVVEIKYVPLKSANAVETVSLIENVLSGRGIGSRRTSQTATVVKYLRQIATNQRGEPLQDEPPAEPQDDELPVEMEVSAAIRESITLTPDLRTNTIIVSAPKESISMIERMIRDLDDSSTGSKSIRIFKLVNADAIAMAEILTELFKLRQGNSMYVLKPREDAPLSISRETTLTPEIGPDSIAARPGDFGGGLSGTELTAVPDERQQLSITVDSRTNSLIVSGTPTYLDLVAQVVEELDLLEANEREVFVYQLRNSVAADVAKVIGDFVEQEQRKLVGTLSTDQLGSAARLLEREITIQGDKQSNTVLVSASPRYIQNVKEMIRKLDVDPPQVLIQVMLAEVTLDSREDWGVDLFVEAEIDDTIISGGFGLASAFVTGLGVPNLSIASSDFDLLIRALKSQGRLQVLSNPSIMAANNAAARIQVGETIRLPVVTTISDTGQVASALEKEDLGVILEVTPSINPDGFVRMVINPEISNLSARTTQISEDFESPIITRRTADTTVTVHDGQTIVIGGLISDRFERRDRKVPVLGDIPVVGVLFRSNTEETAKTELLIVLTPHVIDSPTNFSRVNQITEREIERLSLPEHVKENIRRSFLEGTGALYDAHGNPIEVKMDEDTSEEDP